MCVSNENFNLMKSVAWATMNLMMSNHLEIECVPCGEVFQMKDNRPMKNAAPVLLRCHILPK
jgi:hypothetical protein